MDYSKTILRGRVDSEPLIQRDEGRDCKATFQMEVKSRLARSKERTDVHNIVCFGRVAESCRFLKRGRTVTVEGRPQNFKMGDGGELRAEVVAEKIVFEDEREPEIVSPRLTEVGAGVGDKWNA